MQVACTPKLARFKVFLANCVGVRPDHQPYQNNLACEPFQNMLENYCTAKNVARALFVGDLGHGVLVSHLFCSSAARGRKAPWTRKVRFT